MADLELRHLRVVRAIAEAGSLGRAAARLGISQPALTAQLKRIERTLGGQLFVRGPAGTQPTTLGQFVLNRAEALLTDMELLVSTARQQDPAGQEILRVGCVQALMLGPFVRELELTKRWAAVRTMTESAAPVVPRLLATNRVDVALWDRFDGMTAEDVAGLSVRLLAHEPIFVGLAEGHAAVGAGPVDLADLADMDWVVPPPHENTTRTLLVAACAVAGYSPRFTHFTSEGVVARSLIRQGAAALMQPGAREGDGIVIRPLVGDPLGADLFIAVRADDVLAEHEDLLFGCAARAYHAVVQSNPHFRRWWADHPEAHTDIDAALAGA